MTRSQRMPPDDPLSLRALIAASGKTQAQIADELGVDRTYISQMVTGKVNWVNSAYFPALVGALRLTFRQVEQLRPDAVTGLARAAVEAGQLVPTDGGMRLVEPTPSTRPLPDALQEAITLYSKRYSDLLDPVWQQYLASFRWRTGEPTDPDRWLDLYRDLVRAGVEPGSN